MCLLVLVKSVHVLVHSNHALQCCTATACDGNTDDSGNSDSSHDSDNCAICKYVLSPFVENDKIDFTPIEMKCTEMIAHFADKDVETIPNYKKSRAPPVLDIL